MARTGTASPRTSARARTVTAAGSAGTGIACTCLIHTAVRGALADLLLRDCCSSRYLKPDAMVCKTEPWTTEEVSSSPSFAASLHSMPCHLCCTHTLCNPMLPCPASCPDLPCPADHDAVDQAGGDGADAHQQPQQAPRWPQHFQDNHRLDLHLPGTVSHPRATSPAEIRACLFAFSLFYARYTDLTLPLVCSSWGGRTWTARASGRRLRPST